MNEEILKSCEKLLVVFYENLIKNPMEEVKKMIDFIGFKVDEERIRCLFNHTQGPAKRKHDQVCSIS